MRRDPRQFGDEFGSEIGKDSLMVWVERSKERIRGKKKGRAQVYEQSPRAQTKRDGDAGQAQEEKLMGSTMDESEMSSSSCFFIGRLTRKRAGASDAVTAAAAAAADDATTATSYLFIFSI